MDEEIQQHIDKLAEAIKERLVATLNLKIDLIARSPLDKLDYNITNDLISLGVSARTLTLMEAMVFRDRLDAAYVLSEDEVEGLVGSTGDAQKCGPGGVVVSIFSKNKRVQV
ncbi:hypothetical protein [Pseudomonas sp. C2B4]|uniref:hypothetical protein n=1 Tax=Pseudomonas sp. C2B4 TaxID=2735270 RepID=UPI001586A20D|nr:hypothetical protein [Pseudomonas sp. C2B4]NUU35511.1 hypothetical protein [Pseudomonas sp. C2B4]